MDIITYFTLLPKFDINFYFSCNVKFCVVSSCVIKQNNNKTWNQYFENSAFVKNIDTYCKCFIKHCLLNKQHVASDIRKTCT